ncbi:cobalamin biosynthesis protein [Salinibaculum rarum]|uniref:cobalamin biosynthesis protein n=1 Tax=Salinibaculum rarum TaxID=3058903 RepID=UPI0026602646|nr:cobalamin biosynthesis protein [Salinibaculum sp. KK48]
MSDTATEPSLPETADDLLAATPETAYFWGRVAGDGDLTDETVTVRASDETAAAALAAIVDAERVDHQVTAHESTHDASVVRYEDEYELQVSDGTAARASAALGLPTDGEAGGYRFDVFSDERAPLVRGLLEACGTVCFRESSGSVGISFVHDDERLLETVKTLLAEAELHVPTDDLEDSSSGGYWFGLADDADTAAFAEWVYQGSDESGLYAADRRQKLFRSVERATGTDVGNLST